MKFIRAIQIASAALLLLSPIAFTIPAQAQSVQLGGGDQLVFST